MITSKLRCVEAMSPSTLPTREEDATVSEFIACYCLYQKDGLLSLRLDEVLLVHGNQRKRIRPPRKGHTRTRHFVPDTGRDVSHAGRSGHPASACDCRTFSRHNTVRPFGALKDICGRVSQRAGSWASVGRLRFDLL